MSKSGYCTFEALGRISPPPVEAVGQVARTGMEANGEGRWVQPWSSTWQHLLPNLLCQCDRRHTDTLREQRRKELWDMLLIVAEVLKGDPFHNIYVEALYYVEDAADIP